MKNWLHEALQAVREATEGRSDDEMQDKQDAPTPSDAEPESEPAPEAPEPETPEEPVKKPEPVQLARFVLFGGENYHPLGGWKDYQSMHSTPGAAIDIAAKRGGEWDWWHIVDLRSQQIIHRKDTASKDSDE